MSDKIDILLTKITNIEHDIQKMKKDIEIIKSQTQKMDDHVDFVNDVYTHVEQPLNYVVNKWNRLLGKDAVPNLEYNNDNY